MIYAVITVDVDVYDGVVFVVDVGPFVTLRYPVDESTRNAFLSLFLFKIKRIIGSVLSFHEDTK